MVDCGRAPRPDRRGGRRCRRADPRVPGLRRVVLAGRSAGEDRRPSAHRFTTPEQARALAEEIVRRPGFELVGMMSYEGHIAGLGDKIAGEPRQEPGDRADAARVLRRAARAPRRRGRRRRARSRRWSSSTPAAPATSQLVATEPAMTEATAGLGVLRADAVRQLLELSPRAGRDVRAAGLPASRPRRRHRARRRLPGLRRRAARIAMPTPVPARKGSSSTRWRAPARSRPRCAARPPTACGSATTSTSATPRPASCASASTACTCVAGRRDRRRGPDLPR